MRIRSALTKPLVVLLLMQWGTAFALGVGTADGIHRVVMMPADLDAEHGSHAAAPAPLALMAAPLLLAQAADPPPAPPSPAPAPRPSSCQPPAPPTS